VAVLEYQVQSSDKYHIYKIKFEGEGENLSARCSCPAGKKAGLFCKHIAALLNGDESIIIDPSDKLEDLKKISADSPLLEKAKKYVPRNLKYIARLEGDSPNSYHELYAENDKAAWEKAKKIAEKSIIGLEYIMKNHPTKPPEVLEVMEHREYFRKYFNIK